MSRIDLSKFNIRTDLIIEDNNTNHIEKEIDGVVVTTTRKNGNYITISFDDITNFEDREKVGKIFQDVLKEIIEINRIKETDSCLVVGLGNLKSTPDSLGPKVIDNILVTSHLFLYGSIGDGMRMVSTFTPGVMGNTGIESSKLISSVIREIKPDFVIAIDALASRNIDRINKTIQITDTGIHPGSGIGNNRMEINKKTMGIPVIAIGVPTVVSSTTIVYDTINYLYKHISYIKDHSDTNKLTYHHFNYKHKLKDKELSNAEKENLLGLFGTLSDNEQLSLIEEVLSSTELNLIVTPTEIDFLIDKLSNLIASGINNSLHKNVTNY